MSEQVTLGVLKILVDTAISRSKSGLTEFSEKVTIDPANAMRGAELSFHYAARHYVYSKLEAYIEHYETKSCSETEEEFINGLIEVVDQDFLTTARYRLGSSSSQCQNIFDRHELAILAEVHEMLTGKRYSL